MAAKKKRFETFAERDRKKFVSESFGNIFVTACFLCLTQPLFNFIARLLLPDSPSSAASACVFAVVTAIYKGLGVYMPFLIYQVASTGRTDTCFRRVSSARPWHYALGIPACACIAAAVWYAASVAVGALRQSGYIVTEPAPVLTGDASVYAAVILSSAVIVPLFEEMAFRGVLMGSLMDKAGGWSVLISAVVGACAHPTFMQLPYSFIINLIIAWLYYRTRSLWLTYALNAAASGAVAAAYSLSYAYPDTFAARMPSAAVILGIFGLLCALAAVLLSVKFVARPRKRDFSTRECTKGTLLSLLFWIIIIAAGFRLFMQIYKPDPDEEPQTAEPGTYEPADTQPSMYAFELEDNILDT